jgi:hypothetical protein
VLYSTKELGGRRVLAASAQVPILALGLGAKAIGGSPARTVGPRRGSVRARRHTGSLPRAPPAAVLPPARPGGMKKLGRCASAQRSTTKACQQRS